MVTRSGRTFFDDTTATGSQDGIVGLAKFNYKEARSSSGALTFPGNTWAVDGRHCAATGDAGVNNSVSGPVNGTPLIGADGNGHLDEIVHFQDPYTSDLLYVVYRWIVYQYYIKVWTDVVLECAGGPGGSCGSPYAWIKGPKFTAGVNGNPDGTPFTQITSYDDTGTANATCSQDFTDPVHNSDQPCSWTSRTRYQFNYQPPTNPASVGNPQCTSAHRCFNAIFRSYAPDQCVGCVTPGASAPYWDSGLGGLDAWARAANNYAAYGAWDTCSSEQTPSASRQWEAVGWKSDTNGDGATNYLDGYHAAWTNNFGWRDCINPPDDRALFRAFPAGSQWANYGSFSFNYDSVNYFSSTQGG